MGLGALVAVVVAFWIALLGLNARYGNSPDAVFDLEFGNESSIPAEATLQFLDRVEDPGFWDAVPGRPGSYQSSTSPCTADVAQGTVRSSDVVAGDDENTTIAFLRSISDRQFDTSNLNWVYFDYLENGKDAPGAAQGIRVNWEDADGSVEALLARANAERGTAISVHILCGPLDDYEFVTVEGGVAAGIIVTLNHELRPPDLFHPNKR